MTFITSNIHIVFVTKRHNMVINVYMILYIMLEASSYRPVKDKLDRECETDWERNASGRQQ